MKKIKGKKTSQKATQLSKQWMTMKWTWSAGLFYGYVTVVPLCLYVILKYFSVPSGFVQLLCLYGYSLFVFIPALVSYCFSNFLYSKKVWFFFLSANVSLLILLEMSYEKGFEHPSSFTLLQPLNQSYISLRKYGIWHFPLFGAVYVCCAIGDIQMDGCWCGWVHVSNFCGTKPPSTYYVSRWKMGFDCC